MNIYERNLSKFFHKRNFIKAKILNDKKLHKFLSKDILKLDIDDEEIEKLSISLESFYSYQQKIKSKKIILIKQNINELMNIEPITLGDKVKLSNEVGEIIYDLNKKLKDIQTDMLLKHKADESFLTLLKLRNDNNCPYASIFLHLITSKEDRFLDQCFL